MVRRESVVNLENFKKQYVRRRWKVRQGSGLGAPGRDLVGLLLLSRSPCTFHLSVLLPLSSALLQHRLLVQPPHPLPDEEGTPEDKRGPGEYMQSPLLGHNTQIIGVEGGQY